MKFLTRALTHSSTWSASPRTERAPLRAVLALALSVSVGAGCENFVAPDLGKVFVGENQNPPIDDERPIDDDDEVPPIEIVPAAAQIRLLSGPEYRATVRDLLGIDATESIDHGDRTTGFDSGADSKLDANTFSVLYTEAERLADVYVSERVAQDFSCFDRSNVKDACVENIVDTIAYRAFRRPVPADVRAGLLDAYHAIVNEDETTPLAECDASQPLGDWGMRDGRCRRACGALGGSNCPTAPASSAACAEGTGAVGIAFDCDVCCGPSGLDAPFVDEVRVGALEHVLVRILMSTRFLYRTEAGVDGSGALDAFERASLLSYALTGTMPDDELLYDAEMNALDDTATRAHVQRLLASERGRARITSFVQQWARATDLDMMVKSPELYGKLSGRAQAEQLREELRTFTQSALFSGSGSMKELLTSTRTFVGPDTAALYEAPVPAPSADGSLSPIELDPTKRAGLFTLAPVMAVHSTDTDPDRDRPVKRGLLVYNKLLCGEVGPPSGINIIEAGNEARERVEDYDLLTTREQFEAIMQQDQRCINCHQDFMPYGYAFGTIDGLGRWRRTQHGLPIDTTITDVYLDGAFQSFDGTVDMMRGLAESRTVARCFAKNLVAYTMGASRGPEVETFTDALTDAFIANDTNVATLLEEILASPSLYQRSTEGSAP